MAATPDHPTSPATDQELPESLAERAERLTGQKITPIFIASYILAIIGAWIALLTPASVTLALRVAEIDPDGKANSLALVTGVGAVFAMVSNPVFGRLSDRCTSRFGRRRPFMVGGLLCGVLALLIIGTAPSISLILLGWCLTQTAMNAAIASLIAVLPDRIPEHRRGTVSGLMGMTNQVATVSGTFLIQLTGTTGVAMFAVPALLGLVLVVLFVLRLREVPVTREELPRSSWRDVVTSFWINPVRHPDFFWVFMSRFLVWIGKSLLLTYKTYFLIDHLGYGTDDAARIVGWAMLILGIGVVGGSNIGGWLSDLLGRRKIFIVVASLFFGAGMIVIAFSASVTGFLTGVAIASIGQGIYVGVDFALVASVLPNAKTEAAKGMGIFNIASSLPQSVAPAVAPLFLAIGSSGNNYSALYLGAGGFAVAGAIVVQLVRGSR